MAERMPFRATLRPGAISPPRAKLRRRCGRVGAFPCQRMPARRSGLRHEHVAPAGRWYDLVCTFPLRAGFAGMLKRRFATDGTGAQRRDASLWERGEDSRRS